MLPTMMIMGGDVGIAKVPMFKIGLTIAIGSAMVGPAVIGIKIIFIIISTCRSY